MTSLIKTLFENSVQPDGIFRLKVLPCENAFPEESTKRVFIDSLPASIRGAVNLF